MTLVYCCQPSAPPLFLHGCFFKNLIFHLFCRKGHLQTQLPFPRCFHSGPNSDPLPSSHLSLCPAHTITCVPPISSASGSCGNYGWFNWHRGALLPEKGDGNVLIWISTVTRWASSGWALGSTLIVVQFLMFSFFSCFLSSFSLCCWC